MSGLVFPNKKYEVQELVNEIVELKVLNPVLDSFPPPFFVKVHAPLKILPFKYNFEDDALTIAPKVVPENLVLAVEFMVMELVLGVSLIIPPANSLLVDPIILNDFPLISIIPE